MKHIFQLIADAAKLCEQGAKQDMREIIQKLTGELSAAHARIHELEEELITLKDRLPELELAHGILNEGEKAGANLLSQMQVSSRDHIGHPSDDGKPGCLEDGRMILNSNCDSKQ